MLRRMMVAVSLAVLVAVLMTGGAAVSATADSSITGTVKVAGGSSADTIVFLDKPTAPGQGATAVMDQKNMKFVPHVLPITVGTTVKFTNSDTVAHNVFSPDHEKYQLGTWGPGQSKDHPFAKCAKFPCVYTQLCMIHPEMEGFIVVLPNAYFATANEAGQFTIQNVPAGQYQVSVWNPKAKAQPKAVTVEAGKPATIDFSLSK